MGRRRNNKIHIHDRLLKEVAEYGKGMTNMNAYLVEKMIEKGYTIHTNVKVRRE
jgi:hypothetical protein